MLFFLIALNEKEEKSQSQGNKEDCQVHVKYEEAGGGSAQGA